MKDRDFYRGEHEWLKSRGCRSCHNEYDMEQPVCAACWGEYEEEIVDAIYELDDSCHFDRPFFGNTFDVVPEVHERKD